MELSHSRNFIHLFVSEKQRQEAFIFCGISASGAPSIVAVALMWPCGDTAQAGALSPCSVLEPAVPLPRSTARPWAASLAGLCVPAVCNVARPCPLSLLPVLPAHTGRLPPASAGPGLAGCVQGGGGMLPFLSINRRTRFAVNENANLNTSQVSPTLRPLKNSFWSLCFFSELTLSPYTVTVLSEKVEVRSEATTLVPEQEPSHLAYISCAVCVPHFCK